MEILTHRGLERSKPNFYTESSYEAFQDHLTRGYGIEFDPSFLKDGNIVITHDKGLTRITEGKDTRLLTDLTLPDVQLVSLYNGKIPTFDELMELIKESEAPIHALHLKGIFQEQPYVDTLISHLAKYPDLMERFVIFDVKPDIARFMKSKNENLTLAPSVAHPYDIERYNSAVLGTLISVDDAIKYKQEGLYDWVWLDEWDLTDKDGGTKQFYTAETFGSLKQAGYKISLVTPELHGTSPGLLGGEAHPDAQPRERLMERIGQIIPLQPDALCTDYPEEARSLKQI